jgi:hypothetical protein
VATYFKCVTCKAPRYSVATPDDLFPDLCPGCGAMPEPVGELAELVGYSSIHSHGAAEPQGCHGVLIDRFAEVVTRAEAEA